MRDPSSRYCEFGDQSTVTVVGAKIGVLNQIFWWRTLFRTGPSSYRKPFGLFRVKGSAYSRNSLLDYVVGRIIDLVDGYGLFASPTQDQRDRVPPFIGLLEACYSAGKRRKGHCCIM